MKQKSIVEGFKHNADKISMRKLGFMLCASLICLVTVATIGAMSVIGDTEIVSGNDMVYAETAKVTDKVATIEWKKAGVNEYNLVNEAVKVTTKATTKKTTTTTEPVVTEAEVQPVVEAVAETQATKKAIITTAKKTNATTAKKTSNIQSISTKTMYVREDVNFRTGASKSFGIIKILEAGKKVSVNGKTTDGVWYRVNVDGTTGYCMAEYLTTKAPSKATTKAAVKPATTKTNSGTISYTDEEFNMMCYVLQNEVGGCSEASMIAVANVIINRVKSPSFANSLSGVLTAANQFTAISNYYSKSNPPSQSIINCARRALNGEDNSNGAVYYYAPKYCGTSSWFESLTFCMELEGQRFFK